MAAAAYTTDLTLLSNADATTGWSEPTGATAGGIPDNETDYYIQGTACVSKTFNATGLGGLVYNNGAGVTIPTDGAFMAWLYHGAPNAIATEANGGYRLIIGNSASAYKAWYVRGSDTYAYGGWICVPVNPTVTQDATQGTPTATLQYFGSVVNSVNAVAKGNPYANDILRYGRCEARINGGDLANGYATFAGYAAQNDTNTNRWGLIQAIPGGYQWQGLMTLGYTSAVDFRDSNTSVVVANTKKVTSNFNKIDIRQATSRVDWTGITFTALGTVARGNLEVVDNATVNFDTCVFTDMGTFIFQSNSTLTTTTFRRCNLVTQGGATITDCTFEKTNDAAKALLSTNLGLISKTTFISSGTKHAIEITTAGTYTFDGNIFTGYATSNGTTGNEAIYNNSGGLVTINITGGGSTPTYRNGTSATTVVNNAKTFIVTNVVDGSEVRIFKQSDLSELGGAENVGASPSGLSNVSVASDPDNAGRYKVTYSYAYTADIPVYVVVFHTAYQALRPAAVLKSTDGTLQVAQIPDRQYDIGTVP
jgi:hypothetical protein